MKVLQKNKPKRLKFYVTYNTKITKSLNEENNKYFAA